MPRFFTQQISADTAVITGEDAKHVTKALRMSVGERLTICDGDCRDYDCEILSVGETVTLKILKQTPCETEPSIALRLYQAMPKGEKMEFIIQKAVELGVTEITPILTSRCISRPDEKTMEKKLIRYNKIAAEAAKQCGRGRIPTVAPPLSFSAALKEQAAADTSILFYECGGEPLQKIILPDQKKFAVFVGSEGGFSEEEANDAKKAGVQTATLGKRILRCETAPIAGISILMSLTGNM